MWLIWFVFSVAQYEDEILGRSLGFGPGQEDIKESEYKVGDISHHTHRQIEGFYRQPHTDRKRIVGTERERERYAEAGTETEYQQIEDKNAWTECTQTGERKKAGTEYTQTG